MSTRKPFYQTVFLCWVLALGFIASTSTGCAQKSSSKADREPDLPMYVPSSFGPDGYFTMGVLIDRMVGAIEMTVNGFPIYQAGHKRSMAQMVDQSVGRPINTALAGDGNRVRLQYIPRITRSGQRLQIRPFEGAMMVEEEGAPERAVAIGRSAVDSAYSAWQEALGPVWTSVLRAEAAGALGSASAIEAMRDSVATRPFELTATFDNERGPDFSYLFEEAPMIEGTAADSARLKRYVLNVRDLIRDRRGIELYEEVRPAVVAAAIGSGDEPRSRDEAHRLWMQDAAGGTGWFDNADERADFERENIKLQKWSAGRVWQVSRASGEALFLGWEVFVGYVDGELHVVRLE